MACGKGISLLIVCLVSTATAQCPSVCDCRNYAQQKEILCDRRDLKSIPSNLPSDTQHLRLEYNNITAISEGDLASLASLKTLTLYNNYISYIDPGAFRNQGSLMTLSLQNNLVDSLHSLTFRDTEKLVELNLDSNRMTTFPNETFHPLVKLTTLSVAGNPLQLLPDGLFSGLSNLQTLDMSFVNFEKISGNIFDGLTSLTSLKMRNVTRSGDVLFANETLFAKVTNVTTLNVQGNALTCIPASISVLQAVLILDVSMNPLTCEDFSVLRNLGRLEELRMEHTGMTTLRSRMFEQNTNLLYLYLSESPLSEVEEGAFEGLGQLEDLVLFYNNLTTLPQNVFDPLPVNVNLDLVGNPFKCDCHLRWLQAWLTTVSTADIYEGYEPVCATPANLQGQRVMDVVVGDFACLPEGSMDNTTLLVDQGETLVMECGVTGDPTPQRHWLTPDHTTLSPGMNQPPFSVDDDCTLTIVRVQEEDAGAYSCVGTNAAGSVSLRYLLSVTPTGIERPRTLAPKTTETVAPPELSMPTSASLTAGFPTYIAAIGVVAGVFVLLCAVGLIFFRRVKQKKNRERREVSMVFRNGPIAGSPCGATCGDGPVVYPLTTVNTRYAETLPRIPTDGSPFDPPPSYASSINPSPYDEIPVYDSINEVYDSPRQVGDELAKASVVNINHAYMSQMIRQDSQASCGTPAGYERTMFRNSNPQGNIYTSGNTSPEPNVADQEGQDGGYMTQKMGRSGGPSKERSSMKEPLVDMRDEDTEDDGKVTYQNTRRT